MSQIREKRLVPSLFDRLTDQEPGVRAEAGAGSWDQMQQIRQSVARDLTNLLNTRRSSADIAEEWVEVNRSIAAYGVEDFTSSPVDPTQIRRAIEKSIRTFEPRLSHVTVGAAVTSASRLEYRITADLRVDVRRERIVFDAVLPKHSRRFKVSAS